MQPAIRSPAMVTSSSRRMDAVTRQVPFPSEGRILGISMHLGRILSQPPFIEPQRVSAPAPKRIAVEGKESSSATTPCRANKHEFGVAIPEPDPPDKRKRPPRANREAPAFFSTWAAANSPYPNEKLRSSAPAAWGHQ